MPLVEVPFVDESGKKRKRKEFMGAFTYFFDQTFEEQDRAFAEILPPFPSSTPKPRGAIGSIRTSRTVEYWKEADSQIIRTIVSSSQEDLPVFLAELQSDYPGLSYRLIEKPTSSFADLTKQGYTDYYFDAEQAHGLAGSLYDVTQLQTLMDGLARVLKGRAGCIQVAWCAYDWTHAIEAASIKMQQAVDEIRRGVTKASMTFGGFGRNGVPRVGMKTETHTHPAAGSSIDVHGDRIAREYFEKGQKHPVIVSIRGVILSKDAPDQLNSIFSGVKIASDYIAPWFYSDPRMFRWLRSRALPDPARMLEMHANGGFLCDWGRGRELIPDLCVTSDELPLLVHLPQDPQLTGAIQYTRATGLPDVAPPEKQGVVLGI